MARIVVGMSGGVDSSLAAALVQEAGHEAVGITMRLWPCSDAGGFTRSDACCSPTETMDARAVALSRGLSHYVLDLEDAFQQGVVQDFLDAYAAGRTPNPCIRCNERIKFGELWTHARALGAERVATGHYARTVRLADGRWGLGTAADRGKDQTYFLFSLTQEQLAHAEFPVGGLTKEEVRAAALARGLVTAHKPESQDVCFVGGGGVAAFLRRRLPQAFVPGPIELEDGTVVGRHQGLPGFTLGQRHGLGIAWHEPLYVLALEPARHALIVGPRARLLTRELVLRGCTWHAGALPPQGLRCRVRLRHRGTPVPAVIQPDPALEGGARVVLAEPQVRPSPGQACVAYDEPLALCLGGGWIEPGPPTPAADSAVEYAAT